MITSTFNSPVVAPTFIRHQYGSKRYEQVIRIAGDLDEQVLSILNIILSGVVIGKPVLRKHGKVVEDELSDALKYYPTNSSTFSGMLGQIFYDYKVYGVSYIRIHREDPRIYGKDSYKRLEVLNPLNVLELHSDDYDSLYYSIPGEDKHVSSSDIIRIRKPVGHGELPLRLEDTTKRTTQLVEKLDEGLIKAINANNKLGYYLDLNSRHDNPMTESGYSYYKAIQELYKYFQDNPDDMLVNHGGLGEIKEFNQNSSRYNNNGISFKDQKELFNETIARLLNIPISLFSRSIDATNSKYTDLVRQTFIPFYTQLEEALNLAIFTPEERYEQGYRISIESPDIIGVKNELIVKQSTNNIRNRVLTPNEVREQMGYYPLEGGDVLMSSADILPDDERDERLQLQIDRVEERNREVDNG